jgi:hypothetical protein
MAATRASAPNAKTTPHSRKTQKMKVLAKLLGRVNVFNPAPEFSYVTLKNVDNGEVVDSNAVTAELVKAGITKVNDEFEVLIAENDEGKQVARITKLEPKVVTPEQIASIVNEVDHRLGGEGSYDI